MSSSSMIILQEQAFQVSGLLLLWRTNVNRKQRPYDQPDRNQLGGGYCRLFPSFYRCCNRKSYKIHDNTEIHTSNHTKQRNWSLQWPLSRLWVGMDRYRLCYC